jgi:CBS domain-containing protein
MPDIHDLVRTDFKEVDKRDGLHAVMGWVRGDTDQLPIIMDDGKPYGIVNDRALMSRRIDHRAKIEPYALTTRALPATATLDEAIARMAEYRAAHLPVEQKGKLLGYVSVVDVAREAAWGRTARELCLPVTALRAGQTIGDALHVFTQEYIDHLPVLDAHGRPEGVLSRKRVLHVGSESGAKGRKDAGGQKVHLLDDPIEGFTDQSVTLRPDASQEVVLETLEEYGFAFVQDADGRFLGIITPETLARSAPGMRKGPE